MKKIFFSLVMALALVSCSTEELSNGGTPTSDKGSVQLVLSADDMASRAVDESAIQDVNILEYVNGALATDEVVYLSGKDFSKPVEVLGLKELSATILDNGEMNEGTLQNFIFVIANYGKKIEDREAVATLAKLKEFTMEFSGTTTNLPMTGFYYGGINKTSTTMMNVSLQRAVAKVNFTVDTSNFTVDGTNPPSKVFINSIKLCNVPGNITLYPCQDRPSLPINGETVEWNSTNGHTLFPTKEEMEAENGSVTYGEAENQSSTANTYVAYIPENARGSYSNITDNKNKRPSRCGDNPISEEAEKTTDKSYTYILVDLDYVTADKASKNVTYRIYLGGNETGDMNLLRNTQYNVTTFLVGADPNSTDTRITVNDVYEPGTVTNSEPAANCYMVNMSGAAKTLTIPLSQARRGWSRIANLTDNTTDFEAFKTALTSGNFTVEQLWTTASGTIITGGLNAANKNYADITIPASVTNGNNAVIALKSKTDGKIYWSWHLWFTDYEPSKSTDTERHGQVHQYISDAFKSGGTYYGKYMMDRNLGATVTGVTGAIGRSATATEAAKYYGLMYQWGRKDPFIGSTDGTNVKGSLYDAQGSGNYTQGTDEPTTLANSVQSPGTFFVGTRSNTYDWLTSKNDGLWDMSGKSKSVFDPCPPGWCVPVGGETATNNPWAGFGDGDASLTNGGFAWSGFVWESSDAKDAMAGGLYDNDGVQAWFPASGSFYNVKGALTSVGVCGYCWGAMPNNHVGSALGFAVGGMSVAKAENRYRMNGFPVRCIQE